MVYYNKDGKPFIQDRGPIRIRPGGWAAIYPEGVQRGDQVMVPYRGKLREATVLGTNKQKTKIKVSMVVPPYTQPSSHWVDVVAMSPSQVDQLMDRVLGPKEEPP